MATQPDPLALPPTVTSTSTAGSLWSRALRLVVEPAAANVTFFLALGMCSTISRRKLPGRSNLSPGRSSPATCMPCRTEPPVQLAGPGLQQLDRGLRLHGRVVEAKLNGTYPRIDAVEIEQRILSEGNLPERLLLPGEMHPQFDHGIFRLLPLRSEVAQLVGNGIRQVFGDFNDDTGAAQRNLFTDALVERERAALRRRGTLPAALFRPVRRSSAAEVLEHPIRNGQLQLEPDGTDGDRISKLLIRQPTFSDRHRRGQSP